VPNRGIGRRGLDHLSFMVSALVFGLPRLGSVDVVIASSPTLFSAVSGWLLARVKRVPFVMEVRDLWPEAIVDLGLLRPDSLTVRALRGVARFLYSQAARVVVVTEAFADCIAAQGIPRSHIALIPNGADSTFFAERGDTGLVRKELGLGEGFIVAYVGGHGLSHGLGAILDAAASQPEITYLLVGDGAERERLLAGKPDNVIMRPSVPKGEVPGLYQAADVCLVPLRNIPLFDAFVPSKLFEVLAAGKPVVGAVRGEARAILERSGGALIVDPEDARGIAAAVARLRADPALRARLGQAGRSFVRDHYDRDVLAARYLDLLRDIAPA
jgi:glycosyltransferase involved in cell wall biosynthesis